MTKAAEIIAALLEGKPRPVLERRTGMTPGWGLWMRLLSERLGLITSAAPDAMTGVLLARPSSPRAPRAPAMTRYQAFRAVFYPGWDAPLREERGLRWLAGFASILLHVTFVVLLLLLALVRVAPPAVSEDGSRIQVEFIGADPLEEAGGGESEGEPVPTPALAQAAPRPPAPAPSAQLPVPATQEEPVPAPLVAQQTLQVTETATPTSDFVLPATTPRDADLVPQFTRPAPGIPVREVRVVEVPPAPRPLARREIGIPDVAPQVRVPEREITVALPAIRGSIPVPRPEARSPELSAPVPIVRQAEIAAPQRPTPAATAQANDSDRPAERAGGNAAAAQPSQAPDGSAEGPVAARRAGATPAPRRGDDWGAAARNVPGRDAAGGDVSDGTSGLFNADGSVRLPAEGLAGRAPQAGPPGSRQAQKADADRASKWLERPDYPYEPTMFDRFWVPNESLLAEWVRRNIEEVEIPIPGTSKKVKCVVSILQLGGACGLSDPNLNDQPAEARPPPDIPVKRTPIPVDS